MKDFLRWCMVVPFFTGMLMCPRLHCYEFFPVDYELRLPFRLPLKDAGRHVKRSSEHSNLLPMFGS